MRVEASDTAQFLHYFDLSADANLLTGGSVRAVQSARVGDCCCCCFEGEGLTAWPYLPTSRTQVRPLERSDVQQSQCQAFSRMPCTRAADVESTEVQVHPIPCQVAVRSEAAPRTEVPMSGVSQNAMRQSCKCRVGRSAGPSNPTSGVCQNAQHEPNTQVQRQDIQAPCPCRLQCEQYQMDETDVDQDWSLAVSVCSPTFDVQSQMQVRAVRESRVLDAVEQDIVLDSGADWSCLPLTYANHGVSQNLDFGLTDAQGNPLAINDFREVEFLVHTEMGEPVVWKEVCAISNVTQPLLCKGKLMKAGWWEHRDPTMCIAHDNGLRIPMFFKGNSLCIKASIFRIEGCDESSSEGVQTLLEPSQVDSFVGNHVRFVKARPHESMIAASYGWQMSDAGNMFFRGRGSAFVDPLIVAPVGWPCRTTLVQPTNRAGEWYALEVCQPWAELSDLIAALPHGECEIICIMTEGIEEPATMAFEVDTQGEVSNWSGPQPNGR